MDVEGNDSQRVTTRYNPVQGRRFAPALCVSGENMFAKYSPKTRRRIVLTFLGAPLLVLLLIGLYVLLQ